MNNVWVWTGATVAGVCFVLSVLAELSANRRSARRVAQRAAQAPAPAMAVATIKELRIETNELKFQLAVRDAEIARLTALAAHLQESLEGAASGVAPADTQQFRQLRALLMKELHPDHAPPGSVDQLLREQVFKALWPKVEAISKKG